MSYNAHDIENKWQRIWSDEGVFEVEVDQSKPKFYCLEMFPYPSGNMHMGHVRNYSIGDAMARFQRMRGKNVLYPMGYDSFGMPAENAAKKESGHPHTVTERNIAMIRADQERMGYSYDWRRMFATSTPEYYHWNQEMFLKFYEAGLVERRFAPVNWCNDCDTVLANEQVKNNRCWRCGLEVVQKDMAQWFLRMTEYADELLDELDDIEFPENVKAMQRNWIGRSQGAHINFRVVGSESTIGAFTTRPDTIFGVTFVTLSPEHPLCQELVSGTEYEEAWRQLRNECVRMTEFERINMLKEKKGVPLGRFAINPLSGEEVPIYAGNFVVASYGTGAVMAVPGHDQRDYDFAKRYGLPVRPVLSKEREVDAIEQNPVFDGLGWMVNSNLEPFDGLYGNEAKEAVISALERDGTGHGTTQYRLKDWLLSRQRFWGTPIPMVHCDDCGVVPLNSDDLPVKLPLDVKFSWEGSGNPLASNEEFLHVKCPECDGEAIRETDTMDTFYDSSWYFMRFADSDNRSEPFSSDKVNYWLEGGVDLYIGGIEHAVMHLLYARFFTKATRDLGMNLVGEPFGRLVCQGMLNAPAPFCVECNAEFHIDNFGGNCPNCGEVLTSRSVKMGKSLGNTVSPGEMVSKFGADTVRLFILFGANPEAGMDWSDTALESSSRQMNQIFEAFKSLNNASLNPSNIDSWLLARALDNQSRWIDAMEGVSLREGVMISHYEMLSDWQWYRRRGGSDRDTIHRFLCIWSEMLAPATPHIAEEFWSSLGGQGLLASNTLSDLSDLSESDWSLVLAREEYLMELIDTARNLKVLAQKHTDSPLSRMIVQVASKWKSDLASDAVNLASMDFDFKSKGQEHIRNLPVFENETMRGEIFQIWMTLTTGSKKRRGRIHTWSNAQKTLLLNHLDEVEIINQNSEFLADVLDMKSVTSYFVGEGEDVAGKAKVAFPLEPGIAFV